MTYLLSRINPAGDPLAYSRYRLSKPGVWMGGWSERSAQILIYLL